MDRFAFKLHATVKKKRETQTRVEHLPLPMGGKALNNQLHVA